MSRAPLKPVPSVEPDYTRCRAMVLSGPPPGRQCPHRPVETRQDGDGQLYRVCRVHKRARWFVPWTAAQAMGSLEASRAFNRAFENFWHGGPPKPKLVR